MIATTMTFQAITKRAHLIVLIGLDGAGKTTQAAMLAEWLRQRGYQAAIHPNESLDSFKSALHSIAVKHGYPDGDAMVGLETRQLLFAVIKWNTMIKMRDLLGQDNLFVVMDRYSYCQVAAARYLLGDKAWLIEEFFASCPRPDVTFFLDVSAATAERRMTARATETLIIPRWFLEGHAAAYRGLPEAKQFVVVDGEQTVAAVSRDIADRMLKYFPFLQSAECRHAER